MVNDLVPAESASILLEKLTFALPEEGCKITSVSNFTGPVIAILPLPALLVPPDVVTDPPNDIFEPVKMTLPPFKFPLPVAAIVPVNNEPFAINEIFPEAALAAVPSPEALTELTDILAPVKLVTILICPPFVNEPFAKCVLPAVDRVTVLELNPLILFAVNDPPEVEIGSIAEITTGLLLKITLPPEVVMPVTFVLPPPIV